MGYTGDIMHDIVQKELKRHYPSSEGWVLNEESQKIGKDELVTFTRRRPKNTVIVVGITLARKIDEALISALMGSESGRNPSYISWSAALLVPQGTDLSNLPKGIEVNFMRSFRYEDSDLIWLKHPSGSAIRSVSTHTHS